MAVEIEDLQALYVTSAVCTTGTVHLPDTKTIII